MRTLLQYVLKETYTSLFVSFQSLIWKSPKNTRKCVAAKCITCHCVKHGVQRRWPQGSIRISLSFSAQILQSWKVDPISQYNSYCSWVTLMWSSSQSWTRKLRSGLMERPSGYLKLQYNKWQNNVFIILKMKKNASEVSNTYPEWDCIYNKSLKNHINFHPQFKDLNHIHINCTKGKNSELH